MSFTSILTRRGGVSTLFAAALLTAPGSIPEPHGAASQTVVTGRVLDTAGKPIPSSAVSITERNVRTTSGSDGRYTLTVARTTDRDQVTLLARRVGMRRGR